MTFHMYNDNIHMESTNTVNGTFDFKVKITNNLTIYFNLTNNHSMVCTDFGMFYIPISISESKIQFKQDYPIVNLDAIISTVNKAYHDWLVEQYLLGNN